MSDDENASGDVVRFAAQQRSAIDGEPTCVICGRYGEYVCDATDDDVCSLECRDVCIQRQGEPQATQAKDTSNKRKAAPQGSEVASPPRKVARNDAVDADEASNEIRKRLHIHTEAVGDDKQAAPSLLTSFDLLPEQLRGNLAVKGFASPTPVQMQTIPAIVEGAHVLVSAPTGTGKTVAFLLPVVVQIVERRSAGEAVSGPHVVVLAPVRELAMQIEDEAKTLVKGVPDMKTALLVGGLPVAPQLHRLRQGVQIVVATPGRLLGILTDHCDDSVVERLLDDVRCCIVDEVDMMFSIGFSDKLVQILSQFVGAEVPVQLVFTSATISSKVEKAMKDCVSSSSYLRIQVGASLAAQGAQSSGLHVHAHVAHSVHWVEENAKKTELFRFIEDHPGQPTLVFVDLRVGADMLADAIGKKIARVRALSFHAGKSQKERLQILEDFVEERVQILVTTNLLGRGIDMLSVENVVIFDAPKTIQDYVHLAGRAGRDNLLAEDVDTQLQATSVLYVNAKDVSIFDELVQLFRPTAVRIPKEVYGTLRARFLRNHPQQQARVAVDDARRAFQVVRSSEAQVVTHHARAWGSWKSKMRRL